MLRINRRFICSYGVSAEFMPELKMIDHSFDRIKESHMAAILLALFSTTIDDNKADIIIFLLATSYEFKHQYRCFMRYYI